MLLDLNVGGASCLYGPRGGARLGEPGEAKLLDEEVEEAVLVLEPLARCWPAFGGVKERW